MVALQGYSGMDLWKLKHFRPDLFQGAASSAASGPPAGYRDAPERPGFWLSWGVGAEEDRGSGSEHRGSSIERRVQGSRIRASKF